MTVKATLRVPDQSLIDAVQALKVNGFEAEAKALALKVLPDIDLTSPTDPDDSLMGIPTMRTAIVDGTKVILAQWFDYRGWEVRTADRDDRPDHTPKRLGWVTKEFFGKATAQVNPGDPRRSFSRADEAIRWLLGQS